MTGLRTAAFSRMFARLAAARPGELCALAWSFAYFFCLLAAYYVMRPLRDELAIAGGVRNLPWLFTATFVAMIAAVPLFGALVSRLPRRRFIPIVYRFFVANIAVFWLLLALELAPQAAARAFFVWISVFNLFAVSVFWSFMADLFSSEQGKRLFGFIAAGGSAGALAGPALAVWLAGPIGPVNLLAIAALLLETAVWCALALERAAPQASAGGDPGAMPAPAAAAPGGGTGGGWAAGFRMVLGSPYLAGIALWVALLSLAGTVLYFAQAHIVASASDDPAVRTRIFASIDLAVGLLTLAVQLLATGRLIVAIGTGPAAGVLPLAFALGFAVLAASPVLWVVIAFQAAQRTANFAVANPARESLFTVLARDEKYKAKNVIDVVVFRGADAASGWLFAALRGAGLELASIALCIVPVAAVWLALSLALGRAQQRRAERIPVRTEGD